MALLAMGSLKTSLDLFECAMFYARISTHDLCGESAIYRYVC